jgi:hypothetical protein
VGVDESRGRRTGTKLLLVRPLVYPARVAPIEEIAEVFTPQAAPTVSVRVEVVAAESAQGPVSSLPALSPMPYRLDDTESMQLTAASTAAAVSQKRGALAYASAAKQNESMAMRRGVCIRLRA